MKLSLGTNYVLWTTLMIFSYFSWSYTIYIHTYLYTHTHTHTHVPLYAYAYVYIHTMEYYSAIKKNEVLSWFFNITNNATINTFGGKVILEELCSSEGKCQQDGQEGWWSISDTASRPKGVNQDRGGWSCNLGRAT